MQAVVFCGVQATGKTSFYRARFAETHVRLSLDMLGTRNRERILLAACIEAQQSFVVDNTNPTVKERHIYVAAARLAGFEVVGYYFRSNPREALALNERRAEDDRVPIKGLLGTFKRLELPAIDEGFDSLCHVRMDGAGGFVTAPWT